MGRRLSFGAKVAVLAVSSALAAFLVLWAGGLAALLQPICVDTVNAGSFRCNQPRIYLGVAAIIVAIEIGLLVVWVKRGR
jgi:hypothetical protein